MEGYGGSLRSLAATPAATPALCWATADPQLEDAHGMAKKNPSADVVSMSAKKSGQG